MYLNRVFELSMTLDNEKFQTIFRQSYNGDDDPDSEDECIDRYLSEKGITVVYRNSQYKKKVKLVVNSAVVTEGEPGNTDKLIRKLEKHIASYFGKAYRLDDFTLSGMTLYTDIDTGNQDTAAAYLKVLQRVGRVKGFSPISLDDLNEESSFCLRGNSNAVVFYIYNLADTMQLRLTESNWDRKQIKSLLKAAKGILRTEVRLTKPKAIRVYTDADCISDQITELSKRAKDIFMDIFVRIIPYGDFYKKPDAVDIVRKEVSDSIMRRRMLRLLALIPEKKSLLLAQKEMQCRNIDVVMDAFAKINLSPVTISKRQDVKHLKNIYDYFILNRKEVF